MPRCYFLRNGRIVSVTNLPHMSDKEAIEASVSLFAEQPRGQYDDFEVWDQGRLVHPAPRDGAARHNKNSLHALSHSADFRETLSVPEKPNLSPVLPPPLPPDFPDVSQNPGSETQPAPKPEARPDQVAGTNDDSGSEVVDPA